MCQECFFFFFLIFILMLEPFIKGSHAFPEYHHKLVILSQCVQYGIAEALSKQHKGTRVSLVKYTSAVERCQRSFGGSRDWKWWSVGQPKRRQERNRQAWQGNRALLVKGFAGLRWGQQFLQDKRYVIPSPNDSMVLT